MLSLRHALILWAVVLLRTTQVSANPAQANLGHGTALKSHGSGELGAPGFRQVDHLLKSLFEMRELEPGGISAPLAHPRVPTLGSSADMPSLRVIGTQTMLANDHGARDIRLSGLHSKFSRIVPEENAPPLGANMPGLPTFDGRNVLSHDQPGLHSRVVPEANRNVEVPVPLSEEPQFNEKKYDFVRELHKQMKMREENRL
jgi:hypothetical protein